MWVYQDKSFRAMRLLFLGFGECVSAIIKIADLQGRGIIHVRNKACNRSIYFAKIDIYYLLKDGRGWSWMGIAKIRVSSKLKANSLEKYALFVVIFLNTCRKTSCCDGVRKINLFTWNVWWFIHEFRKTLFLEELSWCGKSRALFSVINHCVWYRKKLEF